MNADAESLQTPGHLDTFTGVSRSNYTAGPSQAYQPIRDDVNVKVNHFVSGSRMTHNIRFGAQIARNLDRGQNLWPGGVLYLDVKGAPDQAQYQSPLVYAAESRSQGVWAEDELTMGRLTMTPGVRFDRMVAISPAAPVVDPAAYSGTDGLCHCNQSFGKTGATIPGLGEMFSWNKVSPRMGINVRLTSDSRTVLRATVGRYYRPVFLNDFTGVHPGITPVTLARFDPVTGDYTTIISVTDSKANLAVDSNIDAPYTNQYSIGVDREIARHMRRQRHLRAQDLERSDRLAGYRRHLRNADRDVSRRPGHGLPADERPQRTEILADEWPGLLQSIRRVGAERISASGESLDAEPQLRLFEDRGPSSDRVVRLCHHGRARPE